MNPPGLEVDDRSMRRSFERLGARTQHRHAAKAVSFGATPIAREVRNAAPVDEGTLRKSIGRKRLRNQKHTASMLIGPRIGGKHRGYHGHLIEHGKINADGSFTAGRPFVAPAATRAHDEATSRMGAKLRELLSQGARP